MKFKIATILFISPFLLNCSSITSGTSQSISVDTFPEKEAICELSNDKGKWFVSSTPGSTVVNRAYGDMTIKCEKNQKKGIQVVPSSVKGTMFGNILLGGPIGVGLDHANGSAYEYPSLITIPLK
jgi:hypothetical protein